MTFPTLILAAADSRQAWAVVLAYAPWVIVLGVFYWVLERGQRKG